LEPSALLAEFALGAGAADPMINMNSWEVLQADVLDDLHLDPANVRLGTPTAAPEADIMADLFRNEKALDLVQGIVQVGYLTHEVPIVLRRDGNLIVVEGNRRVAALKAIQNPYLVPEFQARISSLAAQLPDRTALRHIEVKRAPSQDEADRLIAALHTGDTRVRWSPARQAAFFDAQLAQGKSLADLRVQYPTVGVDKFVLRSRILNLFKLVNYSNPAHLDLLSSRGSATSTLARIYESRPFLDLTGMRMNEDGEIKLKVSQTVFAEMARLIVSGIADGDINTRTIGTTTSPRFLKLMDDLRTAAFGGKKKGQQPGGETATGNKSAAGAAPAARGDGKGTDPKAGSGTGPSGAGKASPVLDIGQLQVPANFPDPVKILLLELSAINVVRFPNATFDLMRTFLEKSIKSHAEARGVNLKPKGNQGYVYLKNCLEWMLEDAQKSGPKHIVQVLKQMMSGRVLDYPKSSDFMNALNHNHHVSVSTAEVRESWSQMKSVLAVALK
jgi:hypothetical protein